MGGSANTKKEEVKHNHTNNITIQILKLVNMINGYQRRSAYFSPLNITIEETVEKRTKYKYQPVKNKDTRALFKMMGGSSRNWLYYTALPVHYTLASPAFLPSWCYV